MTDVLKRVLNVSRDEIVATILAICYFFFTKMNDEQTCEGVTLSTFPLDQIATLLDEISPFAPRERGITFAYNV